MTTIDTAIIGLVCFFLGAASLAAIFLCISNSKRKNLKRKNQTENNASGQKKHFLSRFGVMNLILVIIGTALFAFTITVIDLFKNYGTIPDTLVTCVFGVLGTECGAMAWIKTSKEKNRDRKLELEDRKYYEDKEKAECGENLEDTNQGGNYD